MATLKLAKALLGIAGVILLLCLLESYVPIRGGAYVGTGELLAEGTAAWFLFKSPVFRALSRRSRLWLAGFFLCLFWADFWYIFLFYVHSYDFKLWWTVALTSLFYTFAFLCAFAALISSFDSGIKRAFLRPLSALPLLLSTPILLKFIALPFFASIRNDSFSAYQAGQGLAILSSFCAVNASFIVLLSARRLFWSVFSLGILTLVLGDWALRVELFLGSSPKFGFYEYFWAIGVFLCAVPFLIFKDQIEPVENFDQSSLICTYKLGTVASALLAISFLCVSRPVDIPSIRLLAFGSSLGALLATWISHFLAERVEHFSQRLAELFTVGEIRKSDSFSEIPKELTETLRLALERKIQEERERERVHLQEKLSQTRHEIAVQVAHDIRSPLAALNVAIRNLEGISVETQTLIDGATSRIRSIAENLLERNQSQEAGISIQPLFTLIESLVSEKKLQYQQKSKVRIEFLHKKSSKDAFACINPPQFQRILSNLINNSVEAIENHGEIQILLCKTVNKIEIEVIDDGKGISEEIAPFLGTRGASFGKKGGSGLGLLHARATVESWKGSLKITSQVNQGTSVIISLPSQTPPFWFHEHSSQEPTS